MNQLKTIKWRLPLYEREFSFYADRKRFRQKFFTESVLILYSD
ncbi:hypothetical protein B4134_1416 [Bacillus safensis]|nr:hypothetical protein B4134_1416 [Bacillus safensis]